jgi:hypothetical protein
MVSRLAPCERKRVQSLIYDGEERWINVRRGGGGGRKTGFEQPTTQRTNRDIASNVFPSHGSAIFRK